MLSIFEASDLRSSMSPLAHQWLRLDPNLESTNVQRPQTKSKFLISMHRTSSKQSIIRVVESVWKFSKDIPILHPGADL